MGVKEKKLSQDAASLIAKWRKSRPDLEKKQEEFVERQKQKGTFIKFPDELKISIQLLAAKKHMGYQTYLKEILADHVEAAKKEGKISDEIIEAALKEVANS